LSPVAETEKLVALAWTIGSVACSGSMSFEAAEQQVPLSTNRGSSVSGPRRLAGKRRFPENLFAISFHLGSVRSNRKP